MMMLIGGCAIAEDSKTSRLVKNDKPVSTEFCNLYEKSFGVNLDLINIAKTKDIVMDIEGFLLGSGFALLIVLLGWASQITSKSNETKDIEADFLKKAKLKRSDYKKIVNEGGTTEDSFKVLVEFLYTKKDDDIQIFDKIKKIKKDIDNLDSYYSHRFWILLWMSFCLFVTGGLAFFLSPDKKIFMLLPNVFFVVLIFLNLIKVHEFEKRYTKNISEAMEKL